MKLNSNLMTASNPSSFGMPACGHSTIESTFAGLRTSFEATTLVVRDRMAATTGDLGTAIAYVPGTSAWSPPTS